MTTATDLNHKTAQEIVDDILRKIATENAKHKRAVKRNKHKRRVEDRDPNLATPRN